MSGQRESSRRVADKTQNQQPPKTPTPDTKRGYPRRDNSSSNAMNHRHSSSGDKLQSSFGQRSAGSDGKDLQATMDPFYTGPNRGILKEQKGEAPFEVSRLSFSNRLPSSAKDPQTPPKDVNKMLQASIDTDGGGNHSYDKLKYEPKSRFFLPEQLLRDSPYPLLKYGGRSNMAAKGSRSAGLRPELSALKSPDKIISYNDIRVPSHSETAALVDIAVKYGVLQEKLEVLKERVTSSEKEVETYRYMLQSSINERDEAMANVDVLWGRVRELEVTVRSMSAPATPTHHHHGENGIGYSGHRMTGFQSGLPQTPAFAKFAETPSTSLSVHRPPIRTETPVLKAVLHDPQSKVLTATALKSPPASDLRQQPYRGLLSDYFGSIEKWGHGYARLTSSKMGSLNPFVRAVTSVMGNWRGSDDLVDDLSLRGFVVAAIINRRIGEATMAEDIFKSYDVLKHQNNMELVDRWNKAVAQAQDSTIKRSIIADQVGLFDEMNQEEKYRYWRKDKSEELTNSLMDILNSIIHETHRTKAFEDLRELVVKGYRIAMRMRREHRKWDFNFPGSGSQFQKDNMVVRNHYLLGDPQTTLKHVSKNPDNFKVLLGVSPAIVQVDYSGNAVVTDLVHHSEVLIMRKH